MFDARVILITLLAGAGSLSAQEGWPSKAPPANVTQKEGIREAVERLNNLAESFERFEDRLIGGRSITRLANLICEYDKASAGELYGRALALLPDRDNGLAARGTVRANGMVGATRTFILANALTCNPELRRLLQSTRDTASQLRAARAIVVNDPELAANLADASASRVHDLDSVEVGHLIDLVRKIAQERPNRANELFLGALASLAHLPASESSYRALSVLGTYPFRAAHTAGLPQERQGVVRLVLIGGVSVPDISADRPEVPPGVVHEYLSVAARVLAPPASKTEDNILRYALAFQLLPKARAFAPEMEAIFGTVLAGASQLVPPDRVQGVNHFGRTFQDSEKSLIDKLDHASDPEKDRVLFALFSEKLLRRDAHGSRDAARRVSDPALRARLNEILDSESIAMELSQSEIDTLLQKIGTLREGLRRAVLYLTVAGEAHKRKEAARVDEILRMSLIDVSRLPATERAHLQLVVGIQLASIDHGRALTVLGLAVDGFNGIAAAKANSLSQRAPAERVPAWASTIHVQGYGFDERITVGSTTRTFTIRVPGGLGFMQAFTPSVELSSEAVDPVVTGLRDEETRSEALIALARMRLGRARR